MAAPALERPFRKRDEELDRYINLKLAALGQPVSRGAAGRRRTPRAAARSDLRAASRHRQRSLTGKSPATTGFGSEGALTKAAFNAMPPVVDLNNALVSFILTGYAGFTTSAGYVGPHFRVDGRTVLASRLGYRITALFVDRFLGRIFETPHAVFSEEMLCPEKQDIVQFAAGVDAIVEAQPRVARQYFEDGSVEAACPPLQALLHIMAEGSYHGKGVEDTEAPGLFTRDVALWTRHLRDRRIPGQRRQDAKSRYRGAAGGIAPTTGPGECARIPRRSRGHDRGGSFGCGVIAMWAANRPTSQSLESRI